jgi:hypothetical protein
MGIKVTANDYGDFKTFVSNLPAKSEMFYYQNSTGTSNIFAIDFEMHSLVTYSLVGGLPGSFSTDFPGAIALESGNTTVTIV